MFRERHLNYGNDETDNPELTLPTDCFDLHFFGK
jgi:hypothetical protein